MKHICFEWQLIARNKRLKQQLILIAFFPLFFYSLIVSSNFIIIDYFVLRVLFIIALLSLPGTYFGLLSFSIDTLFIEKLMVSPSVLFDSLRAKYYLNCIFTFILALILLPSVFIGISFYEIISSLFFSIGFTYFVFFQSSLFSYKPMDIKSSSFYNFQGFALSTQLIPILTFALVLGLITLINCLFGESITFIVMLIIGIIFIVTHKLWLLSICRNFEKTKYYRLERFRNK